MIVCCVLPFRRMGEWHALQGVKVVVTPFLTNDNPLLEFHCTQCRTGLVVVWKCEFSRARAPRAQSNWGISAQHVECKTFGACVNLTNALAQIVAPFEGFGADQDCAKNRHRHTRCGTYWFC